MIPILYERGETAFTSNGLGRLPDCGMCQVTEERNGIFEVQFTYPVTGHNYAAIQEGRIIFCTHDESGVAQPFDIYARTQPIDGVVTFYAHHISYRLSRIILKPFTANNCAAALAEMETQTYNPNPFTFWTDKASSGSFSVTVPQPLRETLGGQAGSILDAFGKGDYEWDRFTVKLWQSRGRDTGVTIRYGVNMTDYNRDINYWEAYSGAVPYWTDPETGDMVTPGVVYAPGYDASNAEVIAMDLSEEWDTRPTEEQVSARALKRMRDNKSWLPTDNITISFEQLWQTEEYAAVAPLQRVRLCDKVDVIYGPGNVRVNAVQIIRTLWDVLKDRYKKMELGTARASFQEMIEHAVTDGVLKIVPTKTYLETAIAYATDLIKGGQGGHLVINTDADGHPNELLIMDTDDISTAVNVWRWNLNGLGHSHNGYNGPFDDVAITMDGKINANMIVIGFMSAARLKGGTIDGNTVNAKQLQIIDANGNVIASFSGSVVIGKTDDVHAEVDADSFVLYDKNGNAITVIGDARAAGSSVSLYHYDFGSRAANSTIGQYSVCFGSNNTASAEYSYCEGTDNTASNSYSHCEGYGNNASGYASHCEGYFTTASYNYAHTEGNHSTASGDCAHAEGYYTTASGNYSHAEGNTTVASGNYSHTEGASSQASAYYAHAEGYGTKASQEKAHAEGDSSTASGYNSHAEGYRTIASGTNSHAEGQDTKAYGGYSHAEGCETTAGSASVNGSHAEGYRTTSSGFASHAEGENTTASESGAHAEGDATQATGYCSHAEGHGTIANKESQHVVGRWNVPDSAGAGSLTYIEIVGNGTQSSRLNIRTLDYHGNEWINGTLTQASDSRLKTEDGEVPDVSGVKARMFRWNGKKLRHDDKVHLGYFAQDVEKVAPYLVSEDDMGYKSLDYIGFLVAKMASLEARVAELEKEG